MSQPTTLSASLRAVGGNAATDVIPHPAHALDDTERHTNRVTMAELADLLDATMHEPGPRVGLALCDLGATAPDVIGFVGINWTSALSDHDVVLPVAGRDDRPMLAVVRLRVRSGVEAESLADRLIARAADPIRIGDHVHRVRVHVGVALQSESDSGELLIQRAEAALHRAFGSESRNWERSLSDF